MDGSEACLTPVFTNLKVGIRLDIEGTRLWLMYTHVSYYCNLGDQYGNEISTPYCSLDKCASCASAEDETTSLMTCDQTSFDGFRTKYMIGSTCPQVKQKRDRCTLSANSTEYTGWLRLGRVLTMKALNGHVMQSSSCLRKSTEQHYCPRNN